MGLGVVKSGSPMPSEMTSFIVAAISKNLRMPEGFNPATRLESRPTPASSCMKPPFVSGRPWGREAAPSVAAFRSPATASDRLNVPLVGQLPICQLEGLPVRGLDAKTLLAGTPPARQDFRDLKPSSLPGQRQGAVGIFGIRAAFHQVHDTAFFQARF